MALHGAESWTLRKVGQKNAGSFEMSFWRSMEISWTDQVRNEVVLQSTRGEGYRAQSKKKEGQLDWLHIAQELSSEYVIEGQTERRKEETGRRGRRWKQLLDDIKEATGCWKLNEEAVDRAVRRTGLEEAMGLY